MAAVGASAALGADVTWNPGVSVTPFMALPVPPPAAGPAHQPPSEQHPPPLTTASFRPDRALVLLALPRPPLEAGPGPMAPGACHVMVQVRPEAERPQLPQTQTIVLTQTPPKRSAPGVLCRGAACPAPLFLEASAVETIMPASASGVTQARRGGSCPSLPPQAPQPDTRRAPVAPSAKPGPQPPGASSEGSTDTTPSRASPGDACNPNSVYKNFRRWQGFKTLARRHLPRSPDAEALSCFLIPVLRSLHRRKPTMTLEEGMWRAMQEWQHKSNYDRMIYYEMAEKFMEFEAEDEMRTQELQLEEVPGLLPPAPLRPGPPGPPAPAEDLQPGPLPRADAPRGPQAHSHLRAQETEAADEIPTEAVREYMDIMDKLLTPAPAATGQPGGGWKEDRKDLQHKEGRDRPDPDLCSYMDKLCSQEDFVTKVEAIIHPQFLAQLLSPAARLDLLALAEELEQEEGLSPAQLVEKRLLASKEEEGVQPPPGHRAPLLDSGPSESEASQDAQGHGHRPQLGVSGKACPPETEFKDLQRHGQADPQRSRPKASAVSSRCQERPLLQAPCPASAPQGQGHPFSGGRPRNASAPREASPARETHRPMDKCKANEEALPSRALLWASPESLLPCGRSRSPVPAPGLSCPAGWGPWRSAQSQFFQKLGLSRVAPTAAQSGKCAPGGGRARAEKNPLPGADLRVSGKPGLALGMVHSSEPQKRKCDQSVTERGSKQHRGK